MDMTSTLSLSQIVSSLQLGCRNLSNLEPVASQLSATVAAAGDLSAWNLPAATIRTLNHVRNGNVIAAPESLQALSLLAARAGAREVAAREEGGPKDVSEMRSLEAIRGLMATQEFSKRAPKDGFWARMKDPTDGFSPYVTTSGTKVAFFDSPDRLGGVWGDVIRGHWENGIGLVAFLNDASGACGMIFIHGIGRAPWSRPDRGLWQSSGGSMAFPQERLSFAEALIRVVDKGVAMTHKWRSVDESFLRVGHKAPTGLGGSKGILLHGKNGQGFAKGLDVYGEVLNSLGMTLTGCDEGINAEAADILAKKAPYNIVGTSVANYRGYAPIGHTADGVLQAIGTVHSKIMGGKTSPILLIGYGGIGSILYKNLQENRHLPFSGVIDVAPSRLFDLRGEYEALPLFQDASVVAPSTIEGRRLKWNKIASLKGLARIVEKAPDTKILSPNGGPHPIDFDAAFALIAGGVKAVVGSANNQAGVDAGGSPDAIAWILQAGGVFHAADFVVNKMGAAAVSANAVVAGFDQLKRMAIAVGENVEQEIEYAFRRGVPPFLYERERAARAWDQRISAGEAKGGRSNLPG